MLSASIEELVTNGFEVCRVNRRLYKSGNGKNPVYRILTFDKNSNLMHTREENYNDINDAVASFVANES